jgi:hypothetical protein
VEPLIPGSALKEAAQEAANEQTNLAESFPLLGTTSLAEDDAGNKYFLASPNCAPAAVPPNRALHSLYFAQRPAAKNSVYPIPFHLVSFKISLLAIACTYRLRHLKKRMKNRISMQQLIDLSGLWKEQEACHTFPSSLGIPCPDFSCVIPKTG